MYSSVTLLTTYSNLNYLYNKNRGKAQTKAEIEENSSYSTDKVVPDLSS